MKEHKGSNKKECKYDVVMFDLDGTLSDSAKGVAMCIEKTMIEMNKPVPNLEDTSLYVGPPLLTTFKKLCGLDSDDAQRALEVYRKYYEIEGKYENKLYKGIKEVLSKLKETGAKVVVATSKYEGFAIEVLEYIGIIKMFDMVCGSNADGSRKEKAEIIKYIIGEIDYTDLSKIVLIGDTMYDAAGAVEAGCDFIGVTYGCGKKEQMLSHGAKKLVDTPLKLLDLLLV